VVRSLSAKVCAKAGPCALPELDDSGKCEGDCFLYDFCIVLCERYLLFVACNTVLYKNLFIWKLRVVYFRLLLKWFLRCQRFIQLERVQPYGLRLE
jgi:hypothetical protein